MDQNFFSKISELVNKNVSAHIGISLVDGSEGNFTVTVVPKGKQSWPPFVIQGTAQELDEQFYSEFDKAMQSAKGVISNAEGYAAATQKVADKADKKDTPKAAATTTKPAASSSSNKNSSSKGGAKKPVVPTTTKPAPTTTPKAVATTTLPATTTEGAQPLPPATTTEEVIEVPATTTETATTTIAEPEVSANEEGELELFS